MKKFILLFCVIIFGNKLSFGQEMTNSLYLYENYSLKWNNNRIFRNIDQKSFKASIVGIDNELKEILLNSPSSKKAMDGYDNDLFMGNLFYFGGLSILSADIVLLLVDHNFVTNTTPGLLTYLSILTIGSTTSFIGMGYYQSSGRKIDEAIWQYNKDIISGTKKVSKIKDMVFELGFNNKF